MKKPTITKIESIEDLRDGTFFEVFEFTDIHAQRRTVKIARGDIGAPNRVRDFFLRHGLPKNAISQTDLETLLDSPAPRRRKLPQRFGWANEDTYVSPIGVLGKEIDAGIKWGQPSFQPQAYPLPRSRSGDVSDWFADVTVECLFSSAFTVALCAAFGTPLLRCVDEPSFVINLSGVSKSGKSTAVLLAASFGGVGKESELPNFRSTESATNDLFSLQNDHVLPLNETGLIRGGKANVYHLVRTLSYAIAEGRALNKNARSSYADAAVAGDFKTIAIMTAERSIDQYAEDAGAQRDGGEFARVFDLAVRRGPHQSIFDLSDPDEQSELVVAARCRRLRDKISRNHGVALPEYIQHLVAIGPALPHRVRELQNEFVSCIDQSELPDAAWRHLCQSFGILFAGGVLAGEACLFPLERDQLCDALRNVFLDAARPHAARKDGLGTAAQPRIEDQAKLLGQTLKRLKANGLLVERSTASTAGAEIAGYWENVGGCIVYTMHTASLRKALGSDDRLDAALCFLRDRKALIGQNSSKALKGSLLQQCETISRWPGGGRFRSIVFFRRIQPRRTPL